MYICAIGMSLSVNKQKCGTRFKILRELRRTGLFLLAQIEPLQEIHTLPNILNTESKNLSKFSKLLSEIGCIFGYQEGAQQVLRKKPQKFTVCCQSCWWGRRVRQRAERERLWQKKTSESIVICVLEDDVDRRQILIVHKH